MACRRIVALISAIGAVSCGGRNGEVRVVDDFEKAGPWTAGASEGGVAMAAPVAGAKGRGLRLAYDFQQGAGYAFIRRAIDLNLSENFELSLRLRGEAPASTVEVKFVDESGDNVWWRQFRAKEFTPEWETVRIRRSDIAFAWGPAPDRRLGKIAAIEFVIVGAAKEKGAVDFDSFAIRRLPEPPATPPALVASANAQEARAPASAAVDGDPETAWRTPPRRGSPAILTLDLGYLRDFGGLTLDWAGNGAPSKIEAYYSENKRDWSPMRVLDGSGADATYIRAAEAFGRFVRLRMTPAKGAPIGLAEVKIEDKAFGGDDTAFLETLAARSPHGAFPRSLSGEQSYWTIVGAPAGGKTALLSEDGALEPGPRAFSVEPFMIVDGAVKSWADGAHAHWLTDNVLPLPHVRRAGDEYALDVSVHSSPEKDKERAIVARYRVVNTSAKKRKFTLALAVRPFQVNPPTQVLNIAGGASAIRRAEWDGAALSVNDDWRLYPTRPPESLSLAGSIAASAITPSGGGAVSPREVDAPDGFGSAALYFDFELAPGAGDEMALFALQGSPDPAPAGLTVSAAAQSEEAATAEWRIALGRTRIDGPFEASAILDSIKTALAHILLTRDGAALRPGARSYARAWIRDGAMISESLLRLGRAETATDFARWFAPFQFESGKVPCCVDARGADPVPENDSHGELIFLAAEIYRYTKDRAFAEEMWPHVDKAAEAINALRRSERTPPAGGERPVAYGLLPPSISHEGYSDKPAYSYWDNFWGLQGLRDAAYLADELGRPDRADALRKDAHEFSADISASLEKSGLDFIPGAADRRDFDATSTTVAFAPTGVASSLPSDALSETFERAWRSFIERRDGAKEWDVYTPYEFRQVSAFLRLGRADRAHALLDFYLHDRRPPGWNQWAEVVGRNAREPRFIGDMPHSWAASDFLRAALDLFAYEDRGAGALVLAAGVKPEWLKGAGINVRNLHTPYGPLSYSASDRDGKIVISLAGDAAPPGGFRIPTAFLGGEFDVTINEKQAESSDGAVIVEKSPAEIVLSPRDSGAASLPLQSDLVLTPGQNAVEMTDASGRRHRLLLYLPDAAAKERTREKFPLLLFLHGSGERGDDISKVKIHGPPKLIDQGRDFPFIVASPQLANGAHWEAEALTGLLDALVEKTPADPDRIYVTGLSLGGHGTWALAAANPGRIAAIAPVSGAGAPNAAGALKDMPIWSFHGALDDIVPPGRDISMVEAVNASGGAARLTLYPDLGHDAWTRAYDNPELYDWLLTHRRRRAVE